MSELSSLCTYQLLAVLSRLLRQLYLGFSHSFSQRTCVLALCKPTPVLVVMPLPLDHQVLPQATLLCIMINHRVTFPCCTTLPLKKPLALKKMSALTQSWSPHQHFQFFHCQKEQEETEQQKLRQSSQPMGPAS